MKEALAKAFDEWRDKSSGAPIELIRVAVDRELAASPDWPQFADTVFGQARKDLAESPRRACARLIKIGFMLGWRTRNIYEEMKWKTATKQ